jgi:hypothetical protein
MHDLNFASRVDRGPSGHKAITIDDPLFRLALTDLALHEHQEGTFKHHYRG